MRLRTVHKKSLSKTDKQKKIDKEKKSKGPKLSDSYYDESPYNVTNVDVDLTKLRYGMIGSCKLDYVTLDDGVIKLNNSWLQLILIMIETLITEYNDTYEELLVQNNVANQTFIIDKVYGKYLFDGEQLKVYKIFDTGFYLECTLTNRNIYHAIVGLCKCLNIGVTDIKMHLTNPLIKDIDINFELLEEKEDVVTINDIKPLLTDGVYLVGVEIMTSKARVRNLEVALVAFCNWLYNAYGFAELLELDYCGNTGISMDNEEELDDIILKQKICGSMVCIYTDGDEDDIIDFFKQCIRHFKMSDKEIKFKFRTMKQSSELKEWELD